MSELHNAVARIDELEVRLTFQEDLIQELNTVISDQDKQLLKLQEQMRLLMEKHRELEFRLSEDGEASDERPPHY